MKRFLSLILFTVIAYSVHAQKLKVTALDASTKELYNHHAPYTLGKPFILEVFDNSASVKVGSDDVTYLKESGTKGTYTDVTTNESGTETYTFSLTINSTLGIVTSAVLSWTVQENKGQRRSAFWKITARRP